MTFKNFWIDLWDHIRYGQWLVKRERRFMDGKWGWKYFAIHSRTDEKIYCYSKQIAEGIVALHNDTRG